MVQPAKTGCDAVREEASKYSGWDVNTMVAIATAESHCRTGAKGDQTLTFTQNDRVYGYSLGAFQVRILPGREHCDTFDVGTNVKCAYDVWRTQGYRAWSVYLSGKYKEHL